MNTDKDKTLSVINVLHISFFSQRGSFAAPLLLLWMAMVLFYMSCSRHRTVCLSVTSSAEYEKKTIKSSPKSGEKQRALPHPPCMTLCMGLAFLYLSLSLSLSLSLCKCLSLYPCQTNVALWPRSSTVSVEQLVSIRSPFRSLCARARTLTLVCARTHTHTHTHRHTKKEWGGLLSLAHRSVDGVIESFDQNIWWSSEAPSAGCGHRSVSFH